MLYNDAVFMFLEPGVEIKLYRIRIHLYGQLNRAMGIA